MAANTGAGSRRKSPALRLKSYLLQEAEATSRAAKMAWCAERGLNVVSLQHDGIVIDALPDGLSADEAAELMSSAASRAAGYEVVVEAKGIAMPLIVD